MSDDKSIYEESDHEITGEMDIESTEDVETPDRLIDQVIGQEKAKNIIKKAAEQKRHVLMIGKPGTGKSMLAEALSNEMPTRNLKDVIVKPNEKNENEPKIDTEVPGKAQEEIDKIREEEKSLSKKLMLLAYVIAGGVILYGIFNDQVLFSIITALILVGVAFYAKNNTSGVNNLPEVLIDNSDQSNAPFENATGAHSGALLGDVEHDPLQSGGMGTPPHKRVKAGKIHKAHEGVLYIDEIKTLDPEDQQDLMTAMQKGEFQITGQMEKSSGSMVYTEPVPCNFVLVASGNIDSIEELHPAIRSRIKGYGYEVQMEEEVEDSKETRRDFVRFVAQEVEKSNGVPHFKKSAIAEVIREAFKMSGKKGYLTLELRDLGGIIRAAGDIAVKKNDNHVEKEHVVKAKESSKSIEEQYADKHIEKKKKYGVEMVEGSEVGRVNGLAVQGRTSGIIKPIMAEVADGKGEIKATGKLQEIAEESVTNVSAIIKKITGKDINDLDIHIQFVQSYEGVEGDSASITIATAIISAMRNVGVRQDVAMTGSLSVRGDVLPVGGVSHKIEAAAEQGINKVIIPEANKDDVMLEEEHKDNIEIVPVENLYEVLEEALVQEDKKNNIMKRIKEISDFDINTPSEFTNISES